jgi:fructosamine-3-kinase
MMIPAGIVAQIEQMLEAFTGQKNRITSSHPISGGSINQAVKLYYGDQPFFLKWNHANRFPGMFEAEANGLRLLRSAGNIFIPETIGTGADNHHGFLLLEYVKTGNPTKDFWAAFGHQLGALHQHTNKLFGLDHDNYIGSLVQQNKQTHDWAEFYAEQRLIPQYKTALKQGMFDNTFIRNFEKLLLRLPDLFPVESPSLLHGDLWSGNYLCNAEGNAVLIDPAVYYGHREMDLAMTRLFGGFQAGFYAAYNEIYPLETGWKNRVELCQLYPLLVHVNLFGGGYVSQVKQLVNYYT